MNIAIYQPRVSYYVGGGEVLPMDHALYLSRIGHSVTIITTRAAFIKESEHFKQFRADHKEIKIKYLCLPESLRSIYVVPAGNNWKRWNDESIAVGKIAKNFFSEHLFDIISVYNVVDMTAIPPTSLSALFLLGFPKKINNLYRSCLRKPSVILSVSTYVKRQWQKLASLKHVAVAENGISSSFFVPTKQKKIYDVLYIGRLVHIKGVEYLIRAIHLLKSEGVHLRVAIAGSGPEKKKIEALVKKLGLERHIVFLGYVPALKLVALYNSARCAVFPSYDREGILITMLEASSCGVPVVTTTACSMKEFITHEENGVLVRPRSGVAIARATKKLLSDGTYYKKISKNARKEIVRSWDWTTKINNVVAVYEKAISDN